MSRGGYELITSEVPSPEEARRLWKEGKTIEDWKEERREEKKRLRKESRK